MCVHPCAKPPFRLGLLRQKKRRIFPRVVGKICRRLVCAKENCLSSKSTGFYFCVSRSSDSHISGRQTFLRPNFYLLGGVCRQWPAFAAGFELMRIQQRALFIRCSFQFSCGSAPAQCGRIPTGFPHTRTHRMLRAQRHNTAYSAFWHEIVQYKKAVISMPFHYI